MKNRSNRYRHIVQALFFVFISAFAVNRVFASSGAALLPFLPSVSLHSVCPFGGVASVATLALNGTLVRKITEGTMIFSGTILLMTLILGPVFCSHVCPLGTLQEWIGRLGRKIFKKRYNTFIPGKLHNVLKYLKYVSLALVIWMTYDAARLVFANVDPYYAMYHFLTGTATTGSLIVLGVTVTASLFMERPWCKYACPYGALLGLVGKLSPFKIRRDEGSCTGCTVCDNKCPMNIDLSCKKTIRDAQCIRCMDCVVDSSICRSASLEYGLKPRKKKATAENTI